MRHKFLFFLVALFATPILHGHSDEPKGDATKEEKQKLKGTWQVIKMIDTSEGEASADEIKGFTFEFDGDRVTTRLRKGDDGRIESYAINPSKRPKWIDIGVFKGSPLGEGIYKVESNELFICVVGSTDSDKPTPRPSEFKAKKKEHSLLVLKRVEK